MPPPILFIVNPVAGSQKNKQSVVDLIERDFPAKHADIYFTKSKGDATKAARKAAEQGTPIVVAVGGDGTVNEVASGLIGSQAALGIVPRGSGNGLARALGIPMNTKEALKVMTNGNTSRIDIGKAGHRHFCAVSGVGFDAKVSELFDQSKMRGFVSYIWIVIKEFWRFVPQQYAVEFGADRMTCQPFLISIANTPQYGNGAIIAPKAKMDDGAFDLCLANRLTIAQMLTAVPKLFRGTLDQHSGFNYYKIQKVTFRSENPIRFHVDGEPEKTGTSLTIEVMPHALKVCVP
ncbi:diacylglycerol kinase family lipid kinase [candidate division KSB1 bacterium]|nr:diacylglycerol kinase family lipid kinase [candidate division KSB1 bacterium]